MASEVGREIGAVPAVLDQLAESVTAGAETPAEEGWRRRARYRSKGLSEQRRPGGCCEWYSGWGKMQGWELERGQE